MARPPSVLIIKNVSSCCQSSPREGRIGSSLNPKTGVYILPFWLGCEDWGHRPSLIHSSITPSLPTKFSFWHRNASWMFWKEQNISRVPLLSSALLHKLGTGIRQPRWLTWHSVCLFAHKEHVHAAHAGRSREPPQVSVFRLCPPPPELFVSLIIYPF